MERFFILDKFNTYYDWRLILTNKSIADAMPKTNYVKLDGMSGTLDLTEALTGEVTYDDRVISATFWTDHGNRKDREALLRTITSALHGKKIKIIEPDDPDHYFLGRVVIKSKVNNLAYAEFTIEATCDPWRYSINETVRLFEASIYGVDVVFVYTGVKTLYPTVEIIGEVTLTFNGVTSTLPTGLYRIPSLKLRQGNNVLNVSGNGTVILRYREADI